MPSIIVLSVEQAGGHALACIVDVRDEQQVRKAVQATVDKFGGIDILVNNASAISVSPTLETDMKRFDLMHRINTRGTFLVSKECLPYLLKSEHAHILNISPPLVMAPKWFASQCAYTMAKFGMSMCVLGMAEEFRDRGVAVNALWPRTLVHTAAVDMIHGPQGALHSRKPEVMADAAYAILCRSPNASTGNFYIDEEVLQMAGVKDLNKYSCYPENSDKLRIGRFLPDRFYSKL